MGEMDSLNAMGTINGMGTIDGMGSMNGMGSTSSMGSKFSTDNKGNYCLLGRHHIPYGKIILNSERCTSVTCQSNGNLLLQE